MDTLNTTQSEQYLIQLADNMAAAASSFSSHGYDAFISAREAFINEVHDVLNNDPNVSIM